MIDLPSPNHDSRPAGPVDAIVLHYTGMETAEAALARLRDPAGPASVSAHYVIGEEGTVWRLVPEERRAWHAGISAWRGAMALNGRSVGIEIVNPGHEFGYRPYPAAQMAAVLEVCLGVMARWPIDPRWIVGHSDIAPNRKRDPGELFDWGWLAARGVGIWPAGDGSGEQDIAVSLAAIGYATADAAAIAAFQRRWRPARVDGHADAGTRRRAAAVARAFAAVDDAGATADRSRAMSLVDPHRGGSD